MQALAFASNSLLSVLVMSTWHNDIELGEDTLDFSHDWAITVHSINSSSIDSMSKYNVGETGAYISEASV